MTPLVLRGMHGLGDNLHERAIVRELMRKHELWLQTSWPQLYWDLPAVHLLPLRSPICWMAKNEVKAANVYTALQPPPGTREIRCGYLPAAVHLAGSVLGAMAMTCGVPVGDFRLPIPCEWDAKADALLRRLAPSKPLLICRPLLEVNGAVGASAQCKMARNPDFAAYHAIYEAIRDRYYTISIADAMPGRERILWPTLAADTEFHHGELDIETVAALTRRAALVYCSPCFLTVLAQAVETPLICMFGGFEGQASFSAGARYSPWLPIEPVNPCACWSHTCRHDKTIDVPAAIARAEQFIAEHPCKSC